MSGDWFHASRDTIRRSAGRSVVAAAAYRTATSIECAREGVVHDYTRKGGVKETFVTVPEGKGDLSWAEDISVLTNAMEGAEKRKDGQVGHEWEISLPSVLSDAQRSELSHHLAQQLSDLYGVAAIGAIHAPGREGDIRNEHLHLLFTTREVEANGQLGAKVTVLTDKKTAGAETTRYRHIVAESINAALEAAGFDEGEFVDARSFKERGIDRIATEHLGPAASAMERAGMESDRGAINREIMEERLHWQMEEAQPEVNAAVARDLAARFGEPQPSPAMQDATDRVTQLLAEARAGLPVPVDVVEHATAGRELVDDDTAAGGRNPPAAPPGWVARMKRIGAELVELLQDESGIPGRDDLQPDIASPEHGTGWQAHLKAAGERLKGFAEHVKARAADIIGNERGSVPDLHTAPQEADPFELYLAAAMQSAELEEDDYVQPPDVPEPDMPDYDGPDIE